MIVPDSPTDLLVAGILIFCGALLYMFLNHERPRRQEVPSHEMTPPTSAVRSTGKDGPPGPLAPDPDEQHGLAAKFQAAPPRSGYHPFEWAGTPQQFIY